MPTATSPKLTARAADKRLTKKRTFIEALPARMRNRQPAFSEHFGVTHGKPLVMRCNYVFFYLSLGFFPREAELISVST